MSLAKKLISIFDYKGRVQFVVLFFLLLLGVVLELVGISSIVPFIGIISDPSFAEKYEASRWLYSYFAFEDYNQLILYACMALIAIFLLKNICLTAIKFYQIQFVSNQRVLLSSCLLRSYYNKDYSFHTQRNSSVLLRNVINGVDTVMEGVVFNMLSILTELAVAVSVLAVLFLVDPFSTLIVLSFALISLMLFFRIVRRRIAEYGKAKPEAYGEMIKWVNQGLGGIKEIMVLGRTSYFADAFTRNYYIFAYIERFARLLAFIPRYFVETIAVAAMLIIIVVNLAQGTPLITIMPTLGIFSVAAYRVLPSLNTFFSLLSTFKISLPYLDLIYEDLLEAHDVNSGKVTSETGYATDNRMTFNNAIELQGIGFRYPGAPDYVLKDVSLAIYKGQSVGFVGTTGAGKTTLVDIVLGLLEPEHGAVLVDGRDIRQDIRGWQQQIGYIPQFIYLSDDSVRRNVAFGLPDEFIDDERVWESLKTAQLDTFISELPDKLDAPIGERGVCLSGGQRQRIGIARALYHDPAVLVMDEATSSLDNETEQAFIDAVEQISGEKTILIIAHRLSTIENCDVVISVDQGGVQIGGAGNRALHACQ